MLDLNDMTVIDDPLSCLADLTDIMTFLSVTVEMADDWAPSMSARQGAYLIHHAVTERLKSIVIMMGDAAHKEKHASELSLTEPAPASSGRAKRAG